MGMRRLFQTSIEPYWYKVGSFLIIMFFILLSDAILSDFVPGYIQNIVGTPLLMGLVMATSSMVGILVDLIFPQLLRGTGVKKLMGLAILGSLTFLIALLVSTRWPLVLILLVGMVAWGVYYELDAFMTKQFVAVAAPAHKRGMVWGVVGIFRNLAYFIGPILAGLSIWQNDQTIILVAGAILVVAYLFFVLIKIPEGQGEIESPHEISIIGEVKHWYSLGATVWPVLLMSLLVGIVDASFWTTGTVLNDILGNMYPAGKWFLSMYMLPSLFVGLVVAKWGIYKGKKKWAERFLIVGGLILAGIKLFNSVWWILLVVFMASVFFALAWPLVDATYSDFIVRMGRGRKHMIGMSSSILSLAYVIGPIIGGALASWQGELMSFVWIGGLVSVAATILLIVTPPKIRLPEQEIQSWER